MTGVIVFDVSGTVLEVDTFLLRCRVLGRGVEHQAMAHLARLAEHAGCTHIALACTETGKNQPLFSFLESVAGPSADRGRVASCFTIPVSVARDLKPRGAEAGATLRPAADLRSFARAGLDDARVQNIADSLNSTPRIMRRLTESTRVSGDCRAYRPPDSATEHALVAIWARLLNHDTISIGDDFFALGGHSLLAAQVVSQIRTAFHIDLPLRALFEAPTVESLAVVIDEAQLTELDQYDESELEAMLARMGNEDGLSSDVEREAGLNPAS